MGVTCLLGSIDFNVMLILGIFTHIALVILFAANFIVRIQVLSVVIFLASKTWRFWSLIVYDVPPHTCWTENLSLHPTRSLSSPGGYSLLDFFGNSP